MSVHLAQRGYNDLNATQALILLRMGTERTTPTELRSLGHYLGSNVSYDLKKLVVGGYITQERWTNDLRVINICLSRKGLILHSHLERFYMKLGHDITVNSSLIPSHPLDALESID
jgi:DNA-binding MarR family transcriptional regulator